MNLSLCGLNYSFEVSSLDACEMFEEAVNSYSTQIINEDSIGLLLDLLAICSSDVNVAEIRNSLEERNFD